jgi:hypothetical protein
MKIVKNIVIGAIALFFVSTATFGQAGVEHSVTISPPLNFVVHPADVGGCIVEDINVTAVVVTRNVSVVDDMGTHGEEHIWTRYHGTTASGVSYQGHQRLFTFVNNSLAFELTAITDLTLIGVGTAPNVVATILLHITNNANGELAADVLNVNSSCH